jgi:hypothetical protein
MAALPIAATEYGLIPVYESQRRMLPASASFFCFLGFAYIFSMRHGLARAVFGAGLLWPNAHSPHMRHRIATNYLPAFLILASLGVAATYVSAFESGRGLPTFPALPRSSADAVVLTLSFVAMFLLAEAAFAIMAVREYLQDVLGLSDAAVITGVRRHAEPTMPGSQSRSLAVSYSVVPPGSSNENQVSQFASELNAGAPDQTDDETESRAEAQREGHDREYLQDVLCLSDATVITGVPRHAERTMPGSQFRSVAVSYSVVPPGSSNGNQVSQFASELNAGAPDQTDDETESRAENQREGHDRAGSHRS